MAMFSKRPQTHVSDESAARALSKHFGSFVEAARELGVDRKVLRRLTWSNPAILDAAHERMELAVVLMRGEIIAGLWSSNSRVRERALARLENPVLRESFAGAGLLLDLLTPAAPPRRSGPAHRVIEREIAAGWEREVAAEQEPEPQAQSQSQSQPAIVSRTLGWPAHIRRPARGRRWR